VKVFPDRVLAEQLAHRLFPIGTYNRREQRRKGFAVSYKADGSPVMAMGRNNNELFSELLRELLGEDVLLVGEEDRSTVLPRAASRIVYIDPIDGTRECVAGMPVGWTSLLGFVDEGRPSAGFVVRPWAAEVVFGGPALGGLYRLVQSRIEHLPQRIERHSRLWGCDQSSVTHDHELTRRYRAFIDARSKITRQWGVADVYSRFPPGESLLLLLSGSLSFFINCEAAPWDAAPAAAMVPLIGGDIRYLATGQPLDWSEPSRAKLSPYVVAESPAVAEEVCALWNRG
jgi:fructose-1,6-bisphosphatase/inositol monophosphatase family enzyme